MNTQTYYRSDSPSRRPNLQVKTWTTSTATTSGFMANFAKVLRRAGMCSWWQIRGCWEWEIGKIEKHFEILLPEIYIDFLKTMGRSAGRYFEGTHFFYADLPHRRRELNKALKQDGNPFDLPKETFVFASRRGEAFYFFDTSECHDDPPVFAYKKGERHLKPIADSFSSFLIDSLERQRTCRSDTASSDILAL